MYMTQGVRYQLAVVIAPHIFLCYPFDVRLFLLSAACNVNALYAEIFRHNTWSLNDMVPLTLAAGRSSAGGLLTVSTALTLGNQRKVINQKNLSSLTGLGLRRHDILYGKAPVLRAVYNTGLWGRDNNKQPFYHSLITLDTYSSCNPNSPLCSCRSGPSRLLPPLIYT